MRMPLASSQNLSEGQFSLFEKNLRFKVGYPILGKVCELTECVSYYLISDVTFHQFYFLTQILFRDKIDLLLKHE